MVSKKRRFFGVILISFCGIILSTYLLWPQRSNIFPVIDSSGLVQFGVVNNSELCLYFPYESCGWGCKVGEGEILMSVRNLKDDSILWLTLDRGIKKNGRATTIGGAGHCKKRMAGEVFELVGEVDSGSMMSLKIR